MACSRLFRRLGPVSFGAPLLAAALFTVALPARAADPPAPYDARAAALGATGVAFTENGASVYQNPAALDGVDRLSVTLAAAPAIVRLSAPLRGPGAGSLASDPRVFPNFLAAAALRLHDRVVVGLGAYPASGFVARYRYREAAGPSTLESTESAIEISPAASFAILNGLSIGIGYRITAAARIVDETDAGGSKQTSLHGWSFSAMDAGIYYRPFERLHLGLAYRSKMKASLDGTTTQHGATLDTTSSLTTPHTFRFGLAAHLLPDTLMLTAEIEGQLHEGGSTVETTTMPGTDHAKTTTARYHLRDVVAVGFGFEARPTPELALRAGYREAGSPTSPERPAWFFAPPAAIRTVTWGAGVRLAPWDVDVAMMYSFAHGDAKPSGARLMAGEYGLGALTLAASVTYSR